MNPWLYLIIIDLPFQKLQKLKAVKKAIFKTWNSSRFLGDGSQNEANDKHCVTAFHLCNR